MAAKDMAGVPAMGRDARASGSCRALASTEWPSTARCDARTIGTHRAIPAASERCPVVPFSRGGTFRDEKLLWIVLPEREGASEEAHAACVAPGQGRYKLAHWTLLLEYDDGRVNQVSCIATNPDLPTNGAILNGYPVEPRP